MIDPNRKKIEFNEFEKTFLSDWTNAVTKELKGKSLESLNWYNENAFVLGPYSRPRSQADSFAERVKPEWEIHARFNPASIGDMNSRILHFLNLGVNSVEIICSKDNISEFSKWLKEIHLPFISMHLSTNSDISILFDQLQSKAEKDGDLLSEIKGSFEFSDNPWPVQEMSKKIKEILENWPEMRILTGKSGNVHDLGGNAAMEIGWLLSLGHEWLLFLLESGLSHERISKSFRFQISIGSSFFNEIAKIRVFRNLWSKIGEAYGFENLGAHIQAETSGFQQTAYDEYNNLLRAGSQALSAVIGAADSIHILPFDNYRVAWNERSVRLAINVQHLLSEESNLKLYRDAADGSWYLRDLEEKLTDRVWQNFVDLETKGGLREDETDFFNSVEEFGAKRKEQLKNKEIILVGVNKFPGSTSSNPKDWNSRRLSHDFEASQWEEKK